MDKIQKQRSSIVLYREKGNGEHYIRIKYANNPAIALLLSQESGIQMADNASAYITVTPLNYRISPTALLPTPT